MHILLQTIQWLCILRWFYLWVKICSSHCSLFAFYSTHTEPTHKLYEFVLFVLFVECSELSASHIKIYQHIGPQNDQIHCIYIYKYCTRMLQCVCLCLCVFCFICDLLMFHKSVGYMLSIHIHRCSMLTNNNEQKKSSLHLIMYT